MVNVSARLFWYSFCCSAVRSAVLTILAPRFYGREITPPDGPLLLAANHQSFLDPLLIGASVSRPLNFMARENLFDIPLFGRLIRTLNVHPVKRGAVDPEALRTMLKLLRSGEALVVFPEGTRTKDGRIGGLKHGVASVAARTNARILPVCIEGAFESWPRHRRLPVVADIRVKYGNLIRATRSDNGRSATVEIERQLRSMLDGLKRLRLRKYAK